MALTGYGKPDGSIGDIDMGSIQIFTSLGGLPVGPVRPNPFRTPPIMGTSKNAWIACFDGPGAGAEYRGGGNRPAEDSALVDGSAVQPIPAEGRSDTQGGGGQIPGGGEGRQQDNALVPGTAAALRGVQQAQRLLRLDDLVMLNQRDGMPDAAAKLRGLHSALAKGEVNITPDVGFQHMEQWAYGRCPAKW